MFIKSYLYLFITTLILGSLIAIRANSWFTSWIGLEINLMSMAPIMLNKINKNLTEACLKYFLVQALASTILIAGTTLNASTSQVLTLEVTETLVLISLLIKAGAPPLHFWFPELINKLNWTQCFILFTWQKVAPLLLLACVKLNKLVVVTTLAVVTGSLGGLNQTLSKSLIAYSSIAHSGWILVASKLRLTVWVNYFLIYTLLSYRIVHTLHKTSTQSITEIGNWQERIFYRCLFSFSMLSLGGLPPFLGFLAKVSVISLASFRGMKILIFVFVITSLISLFFYLRLIYTYALSGTKNKILFSSNHPTQTRTTLIGCAALNVLIPLISSTL